MGFPAAVFRSLWVSCFFLPASPWIHRCFRRWMSQMSQKSDHKLVGYYCVCKPSTFGSSTLISKIKRIPLFQQSSWLFAYGNVCRVLGTGSWAEDIGLGGFTGVKVNCYSHFICFKYLKPKQWYHTVTQHTCYVQGGEISTHMLCPGWAISNTHVMSRVGKSACWHNHSRPPNCGPLTPDGHGGECQGPGKLATHMVYGL